MDTKDLRADARRRSQVRDMVLARLGEDHDGFDVDGMVKDLARPDIDFETLTTSEFWDIAASHERDELGRTDAMLIAAIERSRTAWLALIRRPDSDIQTLVLNVIDPADTEKTVEARLREFVNFPEGTSISILPLVG
jgi:hypothetical protein